MQDNKRKENEKINEITYNKATEINYYMAYEKRYSQVYEKNMLWTSKKATPDVIAFLKRYKIS